MRKTAVNIARLLLALTFVLSGFVKAVDPLGTQYKISEYLQAMGLGGLLPDFLTLAASVLLSAVEFCLGIFMLFAIRRRLTSRLMLAVMLVMTAISIWLVWANPVSDCGCFGDAVKLTNWQTFWKNVVLLAATVIVVRWPFDMFRFVSESNQWIVINYSAVFIIAVSGWCLYYLPLFDFRPYHVGVNVKESMVMPEGAVPPQYATTFILEKDGVRQRFSLDDYPDSTWTFIDAETQLVNEGYVPPIHDFSISLLATSEDADATGEGEALPDGTDITEQVLADSGYVFLLVSPHVEQADDSRLDAINELYEYAHEHRYPFYCLTASSRQNISRWREMTGAEYPFCATDETTLKTMIRSNPGLFLLHGGTIVRKWSHNDLPTIEESQASRPLGEFAIGQMPDDKVVGKIVQLLLWFVLPLALLSIADRTWMWTKWLRRKTKKN